MLPFTGEDLVWRCRPVYVTHNRVLKLPAGATTPTELLTAELGAPWRWTAPAPLVTAEQPGPKLAGERRRPSCRSPASATPYSVRPVDSAGTVYVADAGKPGAEAGRPGRPPRPSWPYRPQQPRGWAGTGRTVHVADTSNNRVLKLPAGRPPPTELPFTGLDRPGGVAVDSAGTVSSPTRQQRAEAAGRGHPDRAADQPSGPLWRWTAPDAVTDTGNNRVLNGQRRDAPDGAEAGPVDRA